MALNVLLIGGSRFLGRAVAEAFVARGDRLYELNRGRQPAVPGTAGRMVCDKADRKAFALALTRQSWDVIADTILDEQDLAFVVETLGSDVGRFLHTGSFGVYGEARRIPAPEALPLREVAGPVPVVFNAKLRQDRVLWTAFQEHAFPATLLRMSYIYGPGDLLLDGWGGRSPEFFREMRAGRPVPLPDGGRALLHPGHVRDLARAFPLAAASPLAVGQIYNVGGAHALLLRDYVEKIAALLGVVPRFEESSVAGIRARFPACTNDRGLQFVTQPMCASIEKAWRDLGWRPEIPLEAGLRESVDWMLRENRLD